MAASAWLHSTPKAVSEAPQSLLTARDGALESGGFSRRTLLTRGSLAHSIRVGELLRVAASAWLHSTPEAVSEAPQSLPPFTARDGALKSCSFIRMTLLNERKPSTLNFILFIY